MSIIITRLERTVASLEREQVIDMIMEYEGPDTVVYGCPLRDVLEARTDHELASELEERFDGTNIEFDEALTERVNSTGNYHDEWRFSHE